MAILSCLLAVAWSRCIWLPLRLALSTRPVVVVPAWTGGLEADAGAGGGLLPPCSSELSALLCLVRNPARACLGFAVRVIAGVENVSA